MVLRSCSLGASLSHFIPLLCLMGVGVLGAPPSCKSTPGSNSWPSTEVWAALNQTIEGQLIQPTPPGAVCHSSDPTYDAVACTAVQEAWSSEFFHQKNPISAEWNNWTNDSCLPIDTLPCSSEGYPVYVINATTSEHVKAGIDFARKYNIRLIVKNSGHDYVGRSSASNSLSIWVHNLRGIAFQYSSFTPQNCNVTIEGTTITAGAGTPMLEAYQEAAAINYTVVGGNGRSVALGGFLTGAGHSILAPRYGLAADQVLEMEIVTPQGEILIVNECHNTDLFWAMRGGGGSTFGVMISVTMKAYPSPTIMDLNFGISTAANNSHAFDMVSYVLGHFPALSDAGVSGYPSIFKSTPNPLDGGMTQVSGMVGEVLMLDTTNATDIISLFNPIFSYINSTWPNEFTIVANTTFYPSHYSWYEVNYDPSPVGYENLMSSRLLDAHALTNNATAVKLAMERFAEGGAATVFMVSGKGVHNAQPRGGGNAVLPAWRSTYVHATASAAFLPLNETAKVDAIAATNSWASALRELAPDTGAYVNEGAGRYEPNWQQSFWGANYARLLEIKRTIDPDDVFWCQPCVGNEKWEEVDGVLCQV